MPEGIIEPHKGWPKWVNTVLLWFGIPTALILSALTLLGALGQAGSYLKTACQVASVCATPKPSPPIIPIFETGWVDGGHGWSTSTFCEPRKAELEKQYPAFTITWTALPEQVNKDILGHVTYKYSCSFVFTAK